MRAEHSAHSVRIFPGGASVAPARLEAIPEGGPHEQEHGHHVERVDGPMAGVGEDDHRSVITNATA